ncbi:hypothetical protein M885DRAFT_513952 [Pelagophyceae sp. CCMP2097]|nr:hypothetical protein M885DRAFT_513952 [Pelagophyceae sp. CCMP2097]
MAPLVVTKDEIVRSAFDVVELTECMRTAFIALASGGAYLAPVSHVRVEGQGGSAGGDACIKSGYLHQDEIWVVKVAGGFPGNAAVGLSNSQGVVLCFSRRTGQLEAVLADDGHLTDVRTAAAAALCVRLFSPRPSVVAIYGTGVVAKLVAEYVPQVLAADAALKLVVVSRTQASADAFAASAAGWGGGVAGTTHAALAAARAGAGSGGDADVQAALDADVVITCTPSTEAIVHDVIDGALVIALGADGAGKRELGPRVLRRASVVLCDSVVQCVAFGECASALADESLDAAKVVHLGKFFAQETAAAAIPGRTIVCDLTGVAVQDVAIAKVALAKLAAARAAHPAASPPADRAPLGDSPDI